MDEAAALLTSFGDKFRVISAAVDETSFERATLRHVRNHTRPDDAVLYFHSKGVSDDKQARAKLPNAYQLYSCASMPLRALRWAARRSYMLFRQTPA